MANVKFNKGLLANLPAQAVEGNLYFTTDEAIYLGLANGAYHRFGDFIEVANVAALPEKAHAKALYYAKDENVLCKYDGTEWVQINLNTTYTIAAGATAGSVKLVGSDGSSVEVQVVDVAGLTALIEAADAKGAQGIEDAAAALEAAQAAQKTADDLSDFVGDIPEGYDEETVIAYINKKAEETLASATGGSSESAASVLAALNTYKAANDPKVQANTDAIAVLNGDTADSVGGQIEAAITELDLANTYEAKGTAVTEAGKVQDALDAEIERATGREDAIAASVVTEKERAELAEKANADAAAEALAEAQAKVASVVAGDASVTVAGTSTAPTVAVKLDPAADNAIKLGENGLKVEIGAAPEYSIVKAADSGEYAAIYNLTKDGAIVGASINIPKDLVVKSGSVVDGNIVLVLNDEANTEIVIPASSLIEYVTSGSQAGDMVVINVSDDHKVTASITDGTIGLAKLTTELQTEIGKAHVHDNKSVLDGITADKVAAWDSAEADAIAEAGRLDAALKGELQTAIGEVDAKFADVYTKTEVDSAIDADVKVEADRAKAAEEALDEAKADKATTLAGYGITDAMTADAIAQAIAASEYDDTEIAGKVSTLESDVADLKAIDHDAYIAADEQVVSDMQAYADQAEADAVATANAFTTEALTWGEF